jgi:hypothetical protein
MDRAAALSGTSPTARRRPGRPPVGGARFAVERGHGIACDLKRCEDGGAVAGADATAVSSRQHTTFGLGRAKSKPHLLHPFRRLASSW